MAGPAAARSPMGCKNWTDDSALDLAGSLPANAQPDT